MVKSHLKHILIQVLWFLKQDCFCHSFETFYLIFKLTHQNPSKNSHLKFHSKRKQCSQNPSFNAKVETGMSHGDHKTQRQDLSMFTKTQLHPQSKPSLISCSFRSAVAHNLRSPPTRTNLEATVRSVQCWAGMPSPLIYSGGTPSQTAMPSLCKLCRMLSWPLNATTTPMATSNARQSSWNLVVTISTCDPALPEKVYTTATLIGPKRTLQILILVTHGFWRVRDGMGQPGNSLPSI